MSDYSAFLVNYHDGLQERLCTQELINCLGTKQTTPTISGTTASGISDVLITNYDSNNLYAVVVNGGSAIISNDVVSWTLPSSGGSYTASIYSAKSGFILSDVAEWNVSI